MYHNILLLANSANVSNIGLTVTLETEWPFFVLKPIAAVSNNVCKYSYLFITTKTHNEYKTYFFQSQTPPQFLFRLLLTRKVDTRFRLEC